MGDLVRKLGERVLPEIIPILEKGLDSPQSDERQGVCIGLSEIMTACSRDYVRNVRYRSISLLIISTLDHRIFKYNYSDCSTRSTRSVT